ncbi:VOC family protein [Paenibacillus sp. AK121]|uniref:VOC family protein n=1 Tax=Paenibacillus TaxID=44249 RepID=UPI001C23C19A|nr:VOC family protein [Paenibacillus sp. AK121]MBU9706367.1 VOC family protein [Paenibacillus sp. AK121]MEE4567440.1 VOC family protein [Paenibacillus polymyxa]
MSVKGLAHVAIQARDYQATIAFYTEVLGFKRGHHWSLPSFRIQEASMLISPDQRTCLEIFDNDAVIPAQGKKAASEQDVTYGALLHFAFYVDNVDEIYQKALAHGAKTFVEPNQLTLGEPPLVVTNALVHSPNGEVIEFIEDIDFDMSLLSNK